MAQQTVAYHRLYIWELPVRIYHWLNALCVLVLIVTGSLIGAPIAVAGSGEAYESSWFGIVRFTHFVTAFIFFFNFVFRIYWGFVGNRYARWSNFIPLKPSQWKEIFHTLRVDILQTSENERISIGHNALAGFTYFLSFFAFLFQCITGFALYAGMSTIAFPKLFSWIVPLMGGEFAVRQWHHMAMWFFIIFVIIHVYLVFYHDYVEGRGTTSSMVGGWKFEKEDWLD